MNTHLLTVFALFAFVAIYFACFRGLMNLRSVGEKTREFLQFLMHYAIVFVVMVFVIYCIKLGDSRESWQLGLFPVLQVAFFTLFFYFAPTFLLAYLLYPFKLINKRSRLSIWIAIAIVFVFLCCAGLFMVALSLSNM